MPTWRMEEGECRDSLAMEVAAQCKLPPDIVARASHLYNVPPPCPALHPGCPFTPVQFACCAGVICTNQMTYGTHFLTANLLCCIDDEHLLHRSLHPGAGCQLRCAAALY